MDSVQPLSSDDQTFFQKIINIVYSNPFSEVSGDFQDLTKDQKLTQNHNHDFSAHHYNQLIPLVNVRLAKLSKLGIRSVQSIGKEYRRLLERVFLFEIFHEYTGELDKLIEHQRLEGQQPVPVPFAASMFERFKLRGFSHKEGCRYIAFFYQLRRAYRFIRDGLIGNSQSMRQLRLTLWNNVFTTNTEMFFK